MVDLQATLDAIAEVAVHRCGNCDAELSLTAPSPDFCGPLCQREWTERQAEIVDLVGYREPLDVAAHASNQVEMSSPETTPPWTPCTCPSCTGFWQSDPVDARQQIGPFSIRVRFDTAEAVYTALNQAADFTAPVEGVEVVDVTALSDPFQRWAVVPTNASPEPADLAAWQAVVDDAVRELARQAGIPPELLPNLAEHIEVPRRIVDSGSAS